MLRGSLVQLSELGPAAAAVGKCGNGMRLSSQTLEATPKKTFLDSFFIDWTYTGCGNCTTPNVLERITHTQDSRC